MSGPYHVQKIKGHALEAERDGQYYGSWSGECSCGWSSSGGLEGRHLVRAEYHRHLAQVRKQLEQLGAGGER